MKVTGLLELNALFTLVGLAALWGLRGWTTWRALGCELGLAYVVGLGSLGVAATLALVAGFGLSYATILVLALLLVAAGAAGGVLRGSPLPRERGAVGRPRDIADYLGIVGTAVTALVAIAMLRAAWNQPLIAWDAWSFWVPKAKAIYFFGGIDSSFFRNLPAPSYPLFVPALDAMTFRFTHTVDSSVLGIENWFLFVGFVTAAASIVSRVARNGVVWLFVAVFAVLPEVVHRWYQLMADWTLDAFFTIAALCLLRWLWTRERWVLGVAAVAASAMLATKREGQLLAACLVIGILAATWRERRRTWPTLIGGAVAAYAVNVPWRIWWSVRGLAPDTPDNGVGGLSAHLSRVLPGFRIVLQLALDYRLWALAVPVAVAAALVAWRTREGRTLATFYWGTGIAIVVGYMWVLWSNPNVPLTTVPALTPIPRAVASLAALSVLGAPVLLRAAAAGAAEPVLDVAPRSAWRAWPRARAWVEAASPVRVVAAFVGAEWVATLLLARTVRHTSWIYYQGGDQLWYYTLGWLLGHGQLTQTPVGYGWSALLAPIAAIAGPNLASALPAIVLLNVLVLMPIAMAAVYGIAARIGGRLFGYWALLLWLVVPFLGILYTNVGYHQRYTELTLPQAFGLTAMSDFPTMVATIVSLYFCARVVFDAEPRLVDAVAAGVAAGAAIGIKPATVLFLIGPALAFVVRKQPREAAAFVAAMLPAVITLTVWKERGLGYLPIVGAVGVLHVAGTAAVQPVFALDIQHYTGQLNWSRLANNIDLLREHFWSGHVLLWLFLAGLVGLGRRTRAGLALIGGAILPFAVVKGSYIGASVEDASIWRILMPCWPMFILALASLPLLLPHVPERLGAWQPAFTPLAPRRRLALIGAGLAVTAIFPLVAIAAAGTSGSPVATVQKTQMPVPAGLDVGTTAVERHGRVTLQWRAQHPAGGPVFYIVLRRPADEQSSCSTRGGALCVVQGDQRGETGRTTFVDRAPRGRWSYQVMIAANWLNDSNFGDVYAVSKPVFVQVR